MAKQAVRRPDHRWREVLRETSVALQGRLVGVWESDDNGRVRPVAVNVSRANSDVAARELEAALRRWNIGRSAGRRWVASRLDAGHWCIAPIRTEPPTPPPSGLERRGPERTTLELAGVCIGLIEPERAPGARQAAADALRQSQARLALLVQQIPAVLWTTDRDLVITSSSGAALENLGWRPAGVVGASLFELQRTGEVNEEAVDAHRRALTGTSVFYPLRRGPLCYDAHVEPLRAEDNGIIGVVGIAVDVSGRERAFEEARNSRRELEDFFDNATVGLHWADQDGTILRANQAELDMLGYGRDEYVGHSVTEFHADPDVATDLLRRLRAGETLENVEARLRHKDGSIRHVLINSNVRFDGGRFDHTRCVTRDVTDRKRAEEELLRGALHDPLTGLPNRAYFIERVDQALARERRDPGYRCALLFVDVDDFKVVNDSLGHTLGDQLLVEIAARIQGCVRPGDLAARLGGDEFTLLMEDVAGPADVERATRRVQQRLVAPFTLEGHEVFVTASIGVAQSAGAAEGPLDLLRDADLAMYRAKVTGRGRYQVFDVAMRRRAQARFGMEADLRGALQRSELRVLFQPIVEIRTGRVHAFEALLRWHHPQNGVVMPDEFIPLAEATGLIVPIGSWVLHEACWHAQRWQRQQPKGEPVRINVNISPKQLIHLPIVEQVRAALRESRLDPAHLRLEITETAIMRNVKSLTTLLERLRALGVELHLDDFGSGYSSLSHLPRFPFQAIKIDRSFVHRMGSRRTDQVVVRSIVELARNLGMSVVAEGVETEAQRDRLLEFGCELAQGHYFAQPLEPSAAAAFLQATLNRPAS